MFCIPSPPSSNRWILLWFLLSWLATSTMAVVGGTPFPQHPHRYPIVRQVPGSSDPNPASLKISTTSGLMTGIVKPAAPNVRAFLSIPYAQPPVGELRWRSPQPLTDAMQVSRDVSRYGPSCQQFPDARQAGLFDIPNAFTVVQTTNSGDITGREGEGTFDEDCLTLSVHTPNQVSSENPLPVLIFISGGGMVTGGINVPVQDPSQMIQRSQSHIVVAMNYRVGIFGFPAAEGISNMTENNLGILDQRMAIEWARDNVAAFGGDPSRMVLWGQSAGAFSVGAHEFAFADDPIVSGFIADSGNLFSPFGVAALDTTNFTYVANMLCQQSEGVRDPAEELNCLRQVPGMNIQKFINDRTPKDGTAAEVKFGPSVDGKLLFAPPMYEKLSGMGVGSNVPLIIGSNADEVTVSQPSVDMARNQTVIHALTTLQYTCPSSKIARQRSSLNNPTGAVHIFQYAGNFSNVSPDSFQGAYHGAELPILFGTAGDFGGNGTNETTMQLQQDTMGVMQDLWVKFARDGPKGLDAAGWPSYSNGTAVIFGRNGEAMQLESVSVLEKDCTPAQLR